MKLLIIQVLVKNRHKTNTHVDRYDLINIRKPAYSMRPHCGQFQLQEQFGPLDWIKNCLDKSQGLLFQVSQFDNRSK